MSYQSVFDAGVGSIVAGAASAAAAAAAASAAAAAGTLPVYDLVEYLGASGSTVTSADIGKFPSNVKLTWVVAFIGDATSSSTRSGKFGCTGGSFCSGSGLDQRLISALKGVSNAKVLTPCCLLPSFCCKSYM